MNDEIPAEVTAELEAAPAGAKIAYFEDGAWRVRDKTLEERRVEREMVTVSFPTRADLVEMTYDDLAELGRFVVELARDARGQAAIA